jgi:anti-anti-sigma regulatory factor
MILITASSAQRLLSFRFSGKITADEVRARTEETRVVLAQFKSGFRLLTDLANVDSIDDDCVPEFGKMMDLLKTTGIELVVRIIPDPTKDIGFSILSIFHYGRKVRTVTCKNFPEAVEALKL